jgi:trehalose 6-phosphate synthase
LPQSIDVDAIDEVAAKAAVRRRAAELRTRLGGPRRVVLSVDRLHPAKGIENRLTAYRDLLAGGAIDAATTVLVQVAGPADADTAQTRMLRDRVERKVGQINGTFGRVGHPVVHYLHRVVEPAELVALYLAADVMVATPLVDGMSLVAKEFVAARRDDTGALVLSEFTATAHELPQAFVVNPYDVDALAVGLATALGAAAGDLAARMAAMGPQVRANSVHVWAGRLLAALGQVAVASIPLPDTALGDAIAAR